MKYSALEISNYIITYCHEKSFAISNRKLQSMLYFIQADFLVKLGYPLFIDSIYAISCGVLIEDVNSKYRKFGNGNIPMPHEAPNVNFTRKERKHINAMIDSTSKYSSTSLLRLIFNQTPWTSNYRPHERRLILQNDIYEFFKG